jgi:putative hemolysin
MGIGWEIIIILVLILANGFFAGSEIAILTARRSRLEQQAKRGNRGARAALTLADHPDSFLPTVQVGITLVGTLASVYGGARIVERLQGMLADASIPLVARHNEAIAVGMVVLAITFVSLVLGELVPKRLALAGAERLAALTALPMRALSIIGRPAVVVMSGATNAILRLLGQAGKRQAPVSLEDIEHLILTGHHAGVIDLSEQRMAQRALRLGDRMVREIMHPRMEIEALEADTPIQRAIAAVAMSGFSRLPVYEEDLDHIVGFVYTKDLFVQKELHYSTPLRQLYRPALFVPEYMRLDMLLEQFREKRTQMAIVVDEFGGTRGLVTLEDVLEELVGEIRDERRAERKQEFVARDDGSWLVDGGLSAHDLLDRINRSELRADLSRDFSTVGGLVQSVLGRVPTVGDRTTWNGLAFEVVDMDGRRIDRLLVSIEPEAPQEPAGSDGD